MSPDEFAGHANIHWLGEKDFSELPGYCKASQVGLIPFVSSDLTRHCNPLKLPEYLSAGLPVVTTDIPEVYRFNEYVYIAKDDEAFIKACETHWRGRQVFQGRQFQIRSAMKPGIIV